MAENPLQNSDFLQGDGKPFQPVIENIIKLQQQIKLLKDEMKASGVELVKVRNDSIDGAKKQGVIVDEVTKKQALLTKAESDQAKEIAKLNVAIGEQNRKNKEAAKEAGATGSAYDAQSAALNRMRKQYKDLAFQNKENTKEGKELLKNITDLDKKLKDVDNTVGQNQRNVGNYKDAVKGLRVSITANNEELKKMASQGLKNSDAYKKLQSETAGLKGELSQLNGVAARAERGFESLKKGFFVVGAVLGGAKVAWEGFKKVMASTALTADTFNFNMAGLSESTQQFFRNIANLQLSTLFSDMARAFAIGKEYAETIDAILERRTALEVEEAKYAKTIADLEIKSKNVLLTDTERIASADELLKIEQRLANYRIEVARGELKADQNRLFRLTGVTKALQDFYVTQISTNPKVIEQADLYIEKLVQQDSAMRGLGDAHQEARRKALIGGISDAAVRDVVIAKYNIEKKTGGELFDKVQSSMKNFYLEEARFAEENRKIISQHNSLKKAIEDDNRKAFEQGQKETSTMIKSEADRAKAIEAANAKIAASHSNLAKRIKELEDKRKAERQAELDYQILEEDRITQAEIDAQNGRLAILSEIKGVNREHEMIDDISALIERNGFALLTEEEQQAAVAKIREKYREEDVELEREKYEKIYQEASKYAGATMDLMDVISNYQQAEMNRELAAAGDDEAKKEAIKKEYAEKDREMAKKKSVINGALAVGNALLTKPFVPAGLLFAGIAAARAASEIALINSVKFAKGGFVELAGADHDHGGVGLPGIGEAEGKEGVSIWRKSVMSKHKNSIQGITDAINGGDMSIFNNTSPQLFGQFAELTNIAKKQYQEQTKTNQYLSKNLIKIGEKTYVDMNGNKIHYC